VKQRTCGRLGTVISVTHLAKNDYCATYNDPCSNPQESQSCVYASISVTIDTDDTDYKSGSTIGIYC
jgi:hypothetical protein